MSVYWNQWSHAELVSLHGAQEELVQTVECHDYYDYRDQKEEKEDDEPTLTPYDIDGLTWRDFF